MKIQLITSEHFPTDKIATLVQAIMARVLLKLYDLLNFVTVGIFKIEFQIVSREDYTSKEIDKKYFTMTKLFFNQRKSQYINEMSQGRSENSTNFEFSLSVKEIAQPSKTLGCLSYSDRIVNRT